MAHRPQLDQWFRLGFVVRGLVMIALGYLAFATGRGQSPTGLVEELSDIPGGQLLLLVVIAGTSGYAMFRFAEAALDLSGCGSDAGGVVRRLGQAAGGIGFVALAAITAMILLDMRAAPSGGGGAMPTTREVRSIFAGGIVLMLFGLGFIGAAFAQFAKSVTARFMDTLSPSSPRGICWIGRCGSAARGVIFLMLGWFTFRAGLSGTRLRDSADVLEALSEKQLIFTLVTAGLVLSGIFSLIEARYRRVPEEAEIKRRAKSEIADIRAS